MIKKFSKKFELKKKKITLGPNPIAPVEFFDNNSGKARENMSTQTPITSLPATFIPAPFGYSTGNPVGALKSFTKKAKEDGEESWEFESSEPEEEVKTFYLNRKEDETGVSGTGKVAFGIVLPTGRVAIEWTSAHSSITIFENPEEMKAVHGHSGKTEMVFTTGQAPKSKDEPGIRPFSLKRNEDETGISGTGMVAYGAVLPSGKVIIEWTTENKTIEMFKDIDEMIRLHGHEGKTQIEYTKEVSGSVKSFTKRARENGEESWKFEKTEPDQKDELATMQKKVENATSADAVYRMLESICDSKALIDVGLPPTFHEKVFQKLMDIGSTKWKGWLPNILDEQDFYNFYGAAHLAGLLEYASSGVVREVLNIIEDFAQKVVKAGRLGASSEMRSNIAVPRQVQKQLQYFSAKHGGTDNFLSKLGSFQISFAELSELFRSPIMSSSPYGGMLWSEIAKEVGKLESMLPVNLSNVNQVVLQVDRVVDLEHNNDLFLNDYVQFKEAGIEHLGNLLTDKSAGWDWNFFKTHAPQVYNIYQQLKRYQAASLKSFTKRASVPGLEMRPHPDVDHCFDIYYKSEYIGTILKNKTGDSWGWSFHKFGPWQWGYPFDVVATDALFAEWSRTKNEKTAQVATKEVEIEESEEPDSAVEREFIEAFQSTDSPDKIAQIIAEFESKLGKEVVYDLAMDNDLHEVMMEAWANHIFETPEINLQQLEEFYAIQTLIDLLEYAPSGFLRYVFSVVDGLASAMLQAIYNGVNRHIVSYMAIGVEAFKRVQQRFGSIDAFFKKIHAGKASMSEMFEFAKVVGMDDNWSILAEAASKVEKMLPANAANIEQLILALDHLMDLEHNGGLVLGEEYALVVRPGHRDPLSEAEIRQILDNKTGKWTIEDIKNKAPQVYNMLQYLKPYRRAKVKGFTKTAQVKPGESLQKNINIQSPRIEIDPTIKAEIQDAVEKIVAADPNYFVGVSKIIALHGGPYGQVSSEDPSVVHLNVQRIINEVKSKFGTFDANNPEHREAMEEAVQRVLIEVISHEKGHVLDWDPEQYKFPGGESPAQQESHKIIKRLFPQSSVKGFCKTARLFTRHELLLYTKEPQKLWENFLKYYFPAMQEKEGLEIVDAWEEYTNEIYDLLSAKKDWNEEEINKFIEQLDDFFMAHQGKEASAQSFCKTAQVSSDAFKFKTLRRLKRKVNQLQNFLPLDETKYYLDKIHTWEQCPAWAFGKVMRPNAILEPSKKDLAAFENSLNKYLRELKNVHNIQDVDVGDMSASEVENIFGIEIDPEAFGKSKSQSLKRFTKIADRKFTIGIDIDDVIADLHGILWEMASKYIPLDEEDKKQYHVEDTKHGTKELRSRLFKEMYDKGMVANMPTIPGAVEKINELHNKGHRIILITARSQGWRDQTEQWLKKIGLKYDKLVMTAGEGKSKEAREEGIDVFIDDRPDWVESLVDTGDIKVMVFDQPWNAEIAVPRIREWRRVKAGQKAHGLEMTPTGFQVSPIGYENVRKSPDWRLEAAEIELRRLMEKRRWSKEKIRAVIEFLEGLGEERAWQVIKQLSKGDISAVIPTIEEVSKKHNADVSIRSFTKFSSPRWMPEEKARYSSETMYEWQQVVRRALEAFEARVPVKFSLSKDLPTLWQEILVNVFLRQRVDPETALLFADELEIEIQQSRKNLVVASYYPGKTMTRVFMQIWGAESVLDGDLEVIEALNSTIAHEMTHALQFIKAMDRYLPQKKDPYKEFVGDYERQQERLAPSKLPRAVKYYANPYEREALEAAARMNAQEYKAQGYPVWVAIDRMVGAAQHPTSPPEERAKMEDWIIPIIEEVYATASSFKPFTKFSSPRWSPEEKIRLKELYLKYRQRGIPHHIIYKAAAYILNKSWLAVKQKLESMYDLEDDLQGMKFEHWDKKKIDQTIQDLYRGGKPVSRLRLPPNLMYQLTNHSLPKSESRGFPTYYDSFDNAMANNILIVGVERDGDKLTEKPIKTLEDAIKYYRRKEKMCHAWDRDEIIELLQEAHTAGLPLTYSFFRSHPDIYKPLLGVGRSLEGLRDSVKRLGCTWSDLVVEAAPSYALFYDDNNKLKHSTEELRVHRFLELNNVPFRLASDQDRLVVEDPELQLQGYKHFIPDFIITSSNGDVQAYVEVFGSIADSKAANTSELYREKKKAKEKFYSTLPYKFIAINNNTDGIDLTDEILKEKFGSFLGM
jgi:hypothetical protein